MSHKALVQCLVCTIIWFVIGVGAFLVGKGELAKVEAKWGSDENVRYMRYGNSPYVVERRNAELSGYILPLGVAVLWLVSITSIVATDMKQATKHV